MTTSIRSPVRACRAPLGTAAMLTTAVTALRLFGELQRWNEWLWNRQASGGGALLGIGWLIPIFGIWFARTLVRDGHAPVDRARARRWCGLGVAGVAIVFTAAKLLLPVTVGTFVFVIASLPLCAAAAFVAWPALARVLLVYALLARLPILAITALAVAGNWGTHYEQLAPGSPPMADALRTLVLCGAQLGIWLPLTLLVGGLAGALTVPRPPRR